MGSKRGIQEGHAGFGSLGFGCQEGKHDIILSIYVFVTHSVFCLQTAHMHSA